MLQNKVRWKELMLNNRPTPRANFCLWIALWGRLATRVRLAKFVSLNDLECVFCKAVEEDINHVLYRCIVIRKVRDSLL